MMSLDRGGTCSGVALRMDAGEDAHAALVDLLQKEPPVPPERVTAETDAGPVRAIVFAAHPEFPLYRPEPDIEELADILSSAVGHVGTMAEYLLNTVIELKRVGVHDIHLWRLQRWWPSGSNDCRPRRLALPCRLVQAPHRHDTIRISSEKDTAMKDEDMQLSPEQDRMSTGIGPVGEFFGGAGQRELQRRSALLWHILKEDRRFQSHGRSIALSDPTQDNVGEQIAVARLVGVCACEAVPAADVPSRRAALETAGLTTDSYIEWRGGTDALDAARRVLAQFALPDDLTVRAVDTKNAFADHESAERGHTGLRGSAAPTAPSCAAASGPQFVSSRRTQGGKVVGTSASVAGVPSEPCPRPAAHGGAFWQRTPQDVVRGSRFTLARAR